MITDQIFNEDCLKGLASINEELTKIADELSDLIKNPRFCVIGRDPQLIRLKVKIRELNDLTRKINEELN